MLKNILHLFTISSLLLFASCKESSTESESDNNTNIVPPVTLNLNTSISENNTDQWAQSAKNLAESSAALYNIFVPLISSSFPWKKSGNTWTYEATIGTYSVKYQLVDQGSSYTFTYIINGTFNDKSVTNFTFYETTYAKDNKSGSWKTFELKTDGTPFMELKYDWSFSATGMFGGTLNYYNENAINTDKLITMIEADKSGSFSSYATGNIKTSYYSWSTNGSGQVFFYKPDGLTIDSNHSWGPNP